MPHREIDAAAGEIGQPRPETIFLLPCMPAALSAAAVASGDALVALIYPGLFPVAVAYAAWSHAPARPA